MQPDFEAIEPAAVEFDGRCPTAPSFGDRYFGSADGIGESRAVFLEGNHLSTRFAALDAGCHFVIGELGFGTGLNVLLAARLFESTAPAGARLSLISAEKHPLSAGDLARALAAWPELRAGSNRLFERYPPPAPGFHRIALGERIDLILMFGDARAMWEVQPTPVDAWFLDGFAPARNPAMWSAGLFETLARRSRTGATLATFSAAGAVRRRLAEAGFEIRRREGYGDKRHRLEGEYPGNWRPRRIRTGSVCIVGAGLAGATTARALAERGWRVEVRDSSGIAAGASGNRAGVVYTTPSGIATPQNRFYQSSYLSALRWLGERQAGARGLARMTGVVQHVTGTRQRRKLVSASESRIWPAEMMRWLDESSVLLPGGGVVRPPQWCRDLLDHERIGFRVGAVTGPWPASREIGRYDVIVICTGASESGIEGLPALPLRRIRGQVTECAATGASREWQRAECHDGYVTPAIDGRHCVGATFDLRDFDPESRDADDARNLAGLQEHLPERWKQLGGSDIEVTGQRVGFRCQSRDFLPVAGPVAPVGDGPEAPEAWVNLAHGSRGLSGTPLIAEYIADRLSGLARAADANLAAALAPGRFDQPASPAIMNGRNGSP